jgi:hypothetical protein
VVAIIVIPRLRDFIYPAATRQLEQHRPVGNNLYPGYSTGRGEYLIPRPQAASAVKHRMTQASGHDKERLNSRCQSRISLSAYRLAVLKHLAPNALLALGRSPRTAPTNPELIAKSAHRRTVASTLVMKLKSVITQNGEQVFNVATDRDGCFYYRLIPGVRRWLLLL